MATSRAVQESVYVEYPATPFLKWAGGKRWLVAKYPALFTGQFKRYIEPFLGGGAAFFAMAPKRSILSDVNARLISAYAAVKAAPDQIIEQLKQHQELHSDSYYYYMRDATYSDPIAAAAQFIYLNRTCWNGLYRVNKQGKFNVPRGTKNTVLLESDDFLRISKILKGATLIACDFAETLDLAGGGDFAFVDPPYASKHTQHFLKYHDTLFSWLDQERLFRVACKAKRRGAKIMITNVDHPSVRKLYRAFGNVQRVSRANVLAGIGGTRGQTTELVITSW